MNLRKDLFICHASEDKDTVVRPLYKSLRSEGYDIWYDEAEIKWGDSIPEKINWGLVNSDFIIVVISSVFTEKHWPNRELHSVINQEASSGSRKILPLLVGEQDQIDLIIDHYPLLSDKKFIVWSDDMQQIISQLRGIIPKKEKYVEKVQELERIDISDILVNPQIELAIHDVTPLSETDQSIQKSIDIKSIGGLPYLEILAQSAEQEKTYWLESSILHDQFWAAKRVIENTEGINNIFLRVECISENFERPLSTINGLLKDVEIDPNLITLAISEVWGYADLEGSIRFADEIHSLGFKFALSDFGSSYASLSYLRAIPLDSLMMDSAFVSEMGREGDEVSSEIVVAMIAIAHSLKLKIVACGVRHKFESIFLRDQGCDFAEMIEDF